MNTANPAIELKNKLKPSMTTAEVAEALGMTKREVLCLESRGCLKRLRGSRRPVRFAGEQIFEWVTEYKL